MEDRPIMQYYHHQLVTLRLLTAAIHVLPGSLATGQANNYWHEMHFACGRRYMPPRQNPARQTDTCDANGRQLAQISAFEASPVASARSATAVGPNNVSIRHIRCWPDRATTFSRDVWRADTLLPRLLGRNTRSIPLHGNPLLVGEQRFFATGALVGNGGFEHGRYRLVHHRLFRFRCLPWRHLDEHCDRATLHFKRTTHRWRLVQSCFHPHCTGTWCWHVVTPQAHARHPLKRSAVLATHWSAGGRHPARDAVVASLCGKHWKTRSRTSQTQYRNDFHCSASRGWTTSTAACRPRTDVIWWPCPQTWRFVRSGGEIVVLAARWYSTWTTYNDQRRSTLVSGLRNGISEQGRTSRRADDATRLVINPPAANRHARRGRRHPGVHQTAVFPGAASLRDLNIDHDRWPRRPQILRSRHGQQTLAVPVTFQCPESRSQMRCHYQDVPVSWYGWKNSPKSAGHQHTVGLPVLGLQMTNRGAWLFPATAIDLAFGCWWVKQTAAVLEPEHAGRTPVMLSQNNKQTSTPPLSGWRWMTYLQSSDVPQLGCNSNRVAPRWLPAKTSDHAEEDHFQWWIHCNHCPANGAIVPYAANSILWTLVRCLSKPPIRHAGDEEHKVTFRTSRTRLRPVACW